MKRALVNDRLTPATPDAPALAACPRCRSVVKLRRRQGTFFWQHVRLPRGGCRVRRPADKMPAHKAQGEQ